jgi:hypothetical protein
MDYTPNDEPRLSEEASKHRVNRNGAGSGGSSLEVTG